MLMQSSMLAPMIDERDTEIRKTSNLKRGIRYNDTKNYSYAFHCPYINSKSENDFTELFAEQFAMGASGSQYVNNPLFESAPPAMDIDGIYDGGTINGTLCSNTWVWYYMLYGAPAPESWYTYLGIHNDCYGSSTNFNQSSGG